MAVTRMTEKKEADLVLEGGGVKGLGLVGAVMRLMEDGYTFPRVAGTSAGAIAAAFIAARANAEKLRELMEKLDYSQVPDRAPPGIPGISEGVLLLREGGAYRTDYLHRFMRDELEGLDVSTFGDLRLPDQKADRALKRKGSYRLVVMVTDVTHGCLLRLPWDYELFGLHPDRELVADAVRASMSIPLFFRPCVLRGDKRVSTLVDGGVLSNFPIQVFDRTDGREPRRPTFGVTVLPQLPGADEKIFPALGTLRALPPVHMLEQVVVTALVGHDQTHMERPCVQARTISVDTDGVGIADFHATCDQREKLVEHGWRAADEFLKGWSWERYLATCRRRSFHGD